MSVRFGQLLSRNLQRCAIRLPVASTLAKHSIRRLPIAPLLTSRTFHASPQFRVPAGTANAGVAVEDAGEAELITEFSELGEKGVVDQRLINAITKGMGLKTMTDVQAQTINESIQGIDMYAPFQTQISYSQLFLRNRTLN